MGEERLGRKGRRGKTVPRVRTALHDTEDASFPRTVGCTTLQCRGRGLPGTKKGISALQGRTELRVYRVHQACIRHESVVPNLTPGVKNQDESDLVPDLRGITDSLLGLVPVWP